MPNDDVKTLREAAFACTIRYANTHMSTNDRLYFDAIKICFNRMADMIEREDAQELASQSTGHHIHLLSYDKGWNDAISAVHVKLADVEYGAAILNRVAALRREPRT